MTPYIVKLAVSAVIITVASEVSKRSALLGSILVSLPLVSLLSMVWLWSETSDPDRIGAFSWGVFWLVLPSMALFALLPTLLRKGLGFWTALTVSSAATAVLYAMMIWAIRRYSAAG